MAVVALGVRCSWVCAAVAWAFLCGCNSPPEDLRSARGGGRVLIAAGIGLANAKVHVERLDRFGRDGKRPGEVSASLGVLVTDEQGSFEAAHAQTLMGLHRFRVTGGTYRDPISGELVQRDERDELRALYRFAFLEDRSEGVLVTPVHTLIDARFRQQVARGLDPAVAYEQAYETLNAHLGDLEWREVTPADPGSPAISPTEEVRAAFVLGGLMVLADTMREAAGASAQAVTLTTVIEALAEDLAETHLDGNDDNDPASGSGLEVGECPPPKADCRAEPGTCALGACRPACSLYSNTLRTQLAQATAAFIGTRAYPSRLNHTGLGSEDARAMLDALGKNPDPELFGSACIEVVDRMPPLIGWTAPAQEVSFIKGDVVVAIAGSDDSGDSCRATFPDHPDEDGDPTNCVARFTLRTAGREGPVEISAAAIDRAGNERRVRRTLLVDNTPPVVTVDPSGYVPDARAWWTGSAAPALRGALVEPHLARLSATIDGQARPITVTGSSWQLERGADFATPAGARVRITAEDRAGNVTTTELIVRLDDQAPTHDALPTSVRDERGDLVAFAGVTPTHTHAGPQVPLGGAGCPDVYKYAYLLDEGSPAYGGELGARNPLSWAFVLADAGVGVDPAQSSFRVRVAGTGGAVLLDWTPVAGVDQGAGARRFDLTLTRAGALSIPALGTYEGALEVDLRGRDRLGHEVTGARCWTHHPLAAPLHVSAGRVPGVDGAAAHALSLNAHGLGSSRMQDLSAVLLNDDASGASTAEVVVTNGTAEPVYLRVALSAPTAANASRSFSLAYELLFSEAVDESCEGAPWICAPLPAPAAVSETFPGTPVAFELRLYTADGSGLPVALVAPCAEPGCTNTSTQRTYRLPPRTGASAPRFVVSSWLRDAKILRPTSAAYPAAPPYSEITFAGHPFTGALTEQSYCSATVGRGIPRVNYCTLRSYYKRRQSLDAVTLSFNELSSIDIRHSIAPSSSTHSSALTPFQAFSFFDSEQQ